MSKVSWKIRLLLIMKGQMTKIVAICLINGDKSPKIPLLITKTDPNGDKSPKNLRLITKIDPNGDKSSKILRLITSHCQKFSKTLIKSAAATF